MDADTSVAMDTIPLIQELVPLFKDVGTKAEVGLAALVHSLATVKVVTPGGEVKAKWEVTPLVKDKKGEWLPQAPTWADFCLTHLGLDPSTASRYKRIWQVFAGDLGFDHNDLASAGIHNLRLAVGVVARMYPTIDLPLLEALFGSADCRHCGVEPDRAVVNCPSCGEEYEPTPPGGPAAVSLRLHQLKPPQEFEDFSVLPDVRPMFQDDKIVGWSASPQLWIEGTKGVSYVEPWVIKIIPDDELPDALGVRERHAEQFGKWLKRHFG